MEINKTEKAKKPARVVLISMVVSIIVLIVGVMGMKMMASMKTPPAEAKNGERHLRVEALQVKQEDIPVFITGYGEVKTLNVVPIASEVAGKIIKIHPRLEAGEIIPQGEVLFKIDPTDYMTVRKTGRKRLTILERSHELAKNEYERVRKLFENNRVGTLAGVEAAEKAMLSASDLTNQIAQVLETAETNLERCEVRAPFNARVKSVSLEKGQYVTPGQNVVTLADDSVLEIQVPLDSRDAREWLCFNGEKTDDKTAWFSGLKKVPCKIRWTENNNGQTWDGQLHRVVKFDQQTRTLTVAVRIYAETAKKKNPQPLPLVDGMFCSVKIPGRTLHNVFRLPRQAVSFENTVHLAVNNRLETVPAKVARIEGENVYVYGGLNAGDMVVTTRLIDPLENALLEITNKNQKEKQS
ncbi:MAG: efflux RND transporter periplasmic adaptor subunit [Thermodesulfobacteriota bacterium]|nr:efflux RND transporter periplasmic adaptor subunit [Thermodesulfobacteriota bacterium]